jgi:hypothetical protein
VETETGLVLDIDFAIGRLDQLHQAIQKIRKGEPLRRDYAISAYTGASPSNPFLLAVTNMWPAAGRAWEITDIGVYGPDGHTAVGTTSNPAPSTPAVPASGVAVQNSNSYPVNVTITGGTITQVFVNGIEVGTGDGTYLVPSAGAISITYSVAPTWSWAYAGTTVTTQAIADMYAGPTAGMESPGDMASFIYSAVVPAPGTQGLIGDHKAYALQNDRIYAWVYNAPANTNLTLAGTILDWRIEDRMEMTI